MNTGQLSLAHLRYIFAGEVTGAWEVTGGFGAMLSHMAHIRELLAAEIWIQRTAPREPAARNGRNSFVIAGISSSFGMNR